MIEAFAIFRARHDDAILYLHTELHGRAPGHAPAVAARRARASPEEAVLVVDQCRYLFHPFTPEEMAGDLRVARRAAERVDGRGLRAHRARGAGLRRARDRHRLHGDERGLRRRLEGRLRAATGPTRPRGRRGRTSRRSSRAWRRATRSTSSRARDALGPRPRARARLRRRPRAGRALAAGARARSRCGCPASRRLAGSEPVARRCRRAAARRQRDRADLRPGVDDEPERLRLGHRAG